uniref:Uncharacterized protein n=1 Tax=Aegilops tauschii subsp. strangulata TaxID=200361 RepID=A0A453EM01_AEGTS
INSISFYFFMLGTTCTFCDFKGKLLANFAEWSTPRKMGKTEPARKMAQPCRRCPPATSVCRHRRRGAPSRSSRGGDEDTPLDSLFTLWSHLPRLCTIYSTARLSVRLNKT